MTHFIDKLGVLNIVVAFYLLLFLFFAVFRIFRFNFFENDEIFNKFQSGLFLIWSLILIIILFFYSSYSEATLNFNPNLISEKEQIQILKSHINNIQSRNQSIATSILIVFFTTMINSYVFLKKVKK